MDSKPIKEAFLKAKQDVFDLQAQLYALKQETDSLKFTVSQTLDVIKEQTSVIRSQQEQINELSTQINRQTVKPTDIPTHFSVDKSTFPTPPTDTPTQNPTENESNPSFQQTNPADKSSFNTFEYSHTPYYGLKTSYTEASSGNQGVPTDRQSNQQTDNPSISSGNSEKTDILPKFQHLQPKKEPDFPASNRFLEVIGSIDEIRHDLRTRFKKLTPQEMRVFATIYQLEEEGFVIDYPLISTKLRLSESSIRDYILKITKKGIPVVKTKENNKRILLSIQPDLKKIASLSTIISIYEA